MAEAERALAAEERGSKRAEEPDFWGDPLGPRDKYMRILYNNVNGLKVGEFISTREKLERDRREDKTLTPAKDTTNERDINSHGEMGC